MVTNYKGNKMWIFNGVIFNPPVNEIKHLEGFVYLITNMMTNKKYIGQKHFWIRRKNKKTGRRETKESDWRRYYGSSDILNEDIKNSDKENFSREILHLCSYSKQMTFWEQKEQWERGVLMSDEYYNTNIGGKFFIHERKIYEATQRKITTKNNKWREIRSEQMKGDNNIAKREDVRKKLSEKKEGCNHHQWGIALTEEHVLALRKGHKEKVTGVPKTKEHRDKLSKAKKDKVWWNNGYENKISILSPGEQWSKGRLRITPLKKFKIKLYNQNEIEESLVEFAAKNNMRVEVLRYCLKNGVGSKKHHIEYII